MGPQGQVGIMIQATGGGGGIAGETVGETARTVVDRDTQDFPRPRLVEPISHVPAADAESRRTEVLGERHAAPRRVAPPRPIGDLNRIVDRVARTRVTVLITGETGAGKEVLARRIHDGSPRAGKPLVCVNCAAVCATLIDSELFGFQRGSFTGAEQSKVGLIEAADGGTLFLDEVGELSMDAQAKLLRVLEARVIVRVGSVNPRAIDVRFIAATNVNLEAAVAAGRFREDLLFRLDGIRLTVPPLRTRVAEILPAAEQLLGEFSKREGVPVPVLTDQAKTALTHHAWKGNFRELRNVVERAAVLCTDGRIECDDLMLPEAEPESESESESDADSDAGMTPHLRARSDGDPASERARILSALNACAGNQTQAARLLGMSRRTLITRLDKLDIARPQRRPLRAVPAERALIRSSLPCV